MSDPVVVILTSSGSWECPVAITSVKVECWGPGGRGQSVNLTQGTGGGGGSYARRDAVTVVPGQSYAYTVGAGSSGTNTLFTAGSVTVRGRAGANGALGAPGAGGVAVSADGDTYFSGGNGGATESYGGQYYSGGGGGGAGTTEAGGSASGRLAGAGGSADGGNGGTGRYTNGNGNAGSSYGGGGAGAANASGISTGGAGAAGAIRVTYNLPPAGTPAITEPADGFAIAPGATIDLSARADDPASLDVKYRWKYAKDGGADQTIGDSSVVDSGAEATYAWDTSGLTAGTYVLKCWSVNTNNDVSEDYAAVTIYLAYVHITAPDDESSHVSGELTLTGKGYLTGEGQLRVQWEIDTASPPSDTNDDYDLITSALVGQGESVSVVGNVPHLGTWYLRARTYTGFHGAWGSTDESSFVEPAVSDRKVLQPVISCPGGAAVSLKAYVHGRGPGTGDQTARAIVYADSAGAPGALVGYSEDVVVTDGQDLSWVTFPFATPLALTAGATYWIGLHASTASGTIGLRYATSSETAYYRSSDTYADGPSDPCGAVTAYGSQRTFAFYLDFVGASDWTEILTIYVLEALRLDSGSQVELSIAGVYNKVYCYVEGSSASPVVGTATNTTTAPTYANSPRELYVTAPEGSDSAAAGAIASAQLALHSGERVNLSGLKVKLEDGLKLSRGDRVGVVIERLGIDSTYPIREMSFDVAGDCVEISVGDFWEPQTDQDALVAIAQKLQSLEREASA